MLTFTKNRSSILLLVAKMWSILMVVLLLHCHLNMPGLLENSDFLSCIYSGAKLYAQGHGDDIYTPYQSTTFANQPLDVAAHKFLPHLNKSLMVDFNYSPLVAWLVAPLTYLPANYALLIFQIISIAALVASICLIAQDRSQCQSALWLSSLYLPIPILVWIGQSDLIFGLLPYAIGYYFLRKQQPLIAGLAFSLASLKLQLLILPILLGVVLLINKQWRFLAGFISGLLLFTAANIAVSSAAIFRHWLWAVKFYEYIFTNPLSGFAKQLMISLPCFFIWLFPISQYAWSRYLVYGISTICLLAAFIASMKFYRQHKQTQSWLPYSTVLGLLLLPCVSPHFLYYDLSVYILGALCCLDPALTKDIKRSLKNFIVIAAFIVDGYLALLLCTHAKNLSLCLTFPLLAMLIYWLYIGQNKPSLENTE